MITPSTTGTALDWLTPPAASVLLGWHVLDCRPQDGWIRIGFDGREDFLNPAGVVQGGILAAMLDDTMGPAVFAMSEGRLYTATIDLHLMYLAPALPGPLVCEGQVLQLGKTVAFMEGKLMDQAGKVLVKATTSARLVPAEKLPRR